MQQKGLRNSENWVDFKEVKAHVSMQMLIEHYNVQGLKPERDELVGRCPIHKGAGERAFHVSYQKNCFQCFSCKKRGNVLDFVAAMEQCSVRDAAIKLTAWFSIGEWSATPRRELLTTREKKEAEEVQVAGTEAELTHAEGAAGSPRKNVPLRFQLQGISHSHRYLLDRRFAEEVTAKFGIGFFAGKGSMSGRIVIPIHNELGELVAYAGRSIDEREEERYKFPAGFRKSVELYNLHRVLALGSVRTIIVVEGFFDCLRIHQAGFPCVALMGSALSAEQEELLVQYFTGVVLLFDGDSAGRACTDDALKRLVRKLWVRVVELEDNQQPDQLDDEAIAQLLAV